MSNKKYAKEWLEKAWHNLSGAKLLYDANHYTDIIAIELHYAIEKTLKAFLAYENKKIPKTHELIKIYDLVNKHIDLKDNLLLLKQVTRYHIEEAYLTFERPLPSKDELKEVLMFTYELFDKVCDILDISKEKLK